jgi:hypothetical protein
MIASWRFSLNSARSSPVSPFSTPSPDELKKKIQIQREGVGGGGGGRKKEDIVITHTHLDINEWWEKNSLCEDT